MCYLLKLSCPRAMALALALICQSALAQTIVTACGTDDAPGGVNLKTALAAGGPIIIRCTTGSTTIALTKIHLLSRSTTLDGEGRVKLDAANQRTMFLVSDAAVRLILRRLTVQRGANRSLGNPRSAVPKGGIVSSPGAVELWTVRTLRTLEPYDVRSLLAVENSTFEENTGAFVVRAVEATFVNTVFANNRCRPFISRVQNNQRPRASLERSEVFGNLAPIHWFGDLTISHTRFTNNGTPQTVGGALRMLGGVAIIERSDFSSNRALIGGAIHTDGGRLEVRRGTFEGNHAEQRGGAISIQSGSTGLIEVVLGYLKFRRNGAKDGGAIFVEGHLVGGPLLFAENTASQFGGALNMPRGRVELSRAVFVGNRAGTAGGAIRSGPTGHDRLQMGNALIVRNSAPTGGGFSGRTLELRNASVVANQGGGLSILPLLAGLPTPPGGLHLVNTLVANNGGGNCVASAGAITDGGQNLQFPGSGCGAGVRTIDPLLDSMYIPAPGSPARLAGNSKVCLEDPLIRARDVYGGERPAHQRCAIGAVERDLESNAVRLLPKHRELPAGARKFLEFLGVIRPHRSSPDRGPW